MLYKKEIRGRLRAEYARSLSDEELKRCLKDCVWGHILIPLAKKYRDNGDLSVNDIILNRL